MSSESSVRSSSLFLNFGLKELSNTRDIFAPLLLQVFATLRTKQKIPHIFPPEESMGAYISKNAASPVNKTTMIQLLEFSRDTRRQASPCLAVCPFVLSVPKLPFPISSSVQIFQQVSFRATIINQVYIYIYITYLPHKAVAEVSKDKELIGRECAEFSWFENELMSDSSEVRFK